MKQPAHANYGKLPAPRMTPYLLTLMKTGRVYDIGSLRSHDMPLWDGHPPFRVLPYKWHGETDDVAPPGTLFNDLVMTTMHAGSHIDALNHIGEINEQGDVMLRGRKKASETKQWWGCDYEDGSRFHPIILRALVLDMLKYKGGEDTGGQITMQRGYGITPEDIKGCMQAQKLEVKENEPTAFLIRTGMFKYFLAKMENYGGGAAGPNLDAEKYMASIGGVLTGSDTVSYERMLEPNHLVHRWMMEQGLFMNEVLNLEEICEHEVYEGVYIALPLKIRGTSGSLIDPIVVC